MNAIESPAHRYPSPVSNPETEEFWHAARDGQLLLPRCHGCGKHHWYPRRVCPFCMSDRVEWLPSSGNAEVYSYTVMRLAQPPFVLAYVTLDEGPSMLTHLVGKHTDAWQIGDRVRVEFALTDGDYPVPVFAPAKTSTAEGSAP